jgi:hypothetical protein
VSASDSWKLLVFRDGRRVLPARDLCRDLSRQVERVLSFTDFSSQFARDELIDAVLRAGELECALSDYDEESKASRTLAGIADRLARALVEQKAPQLDAGELDRLNTLDLPDRLSIATPEGFCYYGLHPLDYADLLDKSRLGTHAAAVVGIRSIGATLSAIVNAWSGSKGISAQRTTVRPTGHPFDRSVTFSITQQKWVATQIQCGAEFLIVDEGPGLSGSSFLAVAEALEREGVPASGISLLPSSIPDLGNLIATNAADRWSRFRTLPLQPTKYIPTGAGEYVGEGGWRRHVFASPAEWPGVWSWTERQKYLSHDGLQIFRFDGHGYYGKDVRHRCQLLHEHGWGPEAASAGNGFSVSPWLNGRKPSGTDRETIIQLARYCAFRAGHFSCPAVSQMELEQMAEVNLERALGASRQVSLPVERPVIADARMMPYEWVRSPEGRLLKVDAASHGDDHFYPGPTDIAWDLAGAIVEWNFDPFAAKSLVENYEQISGDPISTRLDNYLIAYCAFRLAFTASSGISAGNHEERARFKREQMHYHKTLTFLLGLLATA